MNNGGQQAGMVQNIVVGLVTDNVDPDELGRMKVKFPTMHNEPVSFWIRQMAPMAGKERGFYSLPEVGDEVLVAFLQGSQDVGVVMGQLWNGVDKPPPEAKDALPGPSKTDTGATWSTDKFTDGSKSIEENDRRFWKSRSGHLFVFDDTNAAETVQIWDKEHILSIVFDSKEKRILIANTDGDIHLRAKQNIFFETTQGDVKLRSGKNITIESVQNTELKVGQNFTTETTGSVSHSSNLSTEMSAKTGMTISSDTTATFGGKVSTSVTGASTSLKGDAMAEVMAPLIKIA